MFVAGHLCVAYIPLDICVIGLGDGSYGVHIQYRVAGVD